MSTINNGGNGGTNNGHFSSCSSSDEIKFIVHSLKCTLSASDRFHKFIELSSSHGSVMVDNLTTIQSILLEIILKLLSSFKFKFTSLITCNGLISRPGFIEMVNQMDKYLMDDYHHWSLIIEETRQSADKFSTVNKVKYEDLVQFIHLTLDHITKHNISLDLQSFAILFNIMVNPQITDLMDHVPIPCNMLDFSPLSILPARKPNQVRVIKAANCVTPPGSPMTIHSKNSFSTHRRRLNFDALDDEEEENVRNNDDNNSSLDHSANRPEDYSYTPHKFKLPLDIPKELKVDHLLSDPRIVKTNPKKRSIRTVSPNGTIAVNLTSAKTNAESICETDTSVVDANPNSAKRKRIVWDLD